MFFNILKILCFVFIIVTLINYVRYLRKHKIYAYRCSMIVTYSHRALLRPALKVRGDNFRQKHTIFIGGKKYFPRRKRWEFRFGLKSARP